MSNIWKLAIVAALFFVLGSMTVVSADKIKQFVISSEDGSQNVGVTEDGRLKVDAGELAVVLPEVQQVEVGNLPLTPDGRLMVTLPVPEGATLLQTLDVELTTETDEVTPWVDARGFTRFLLVTRHNKRDFKLGADGVTLSVHESPDEVLDYGEMSGIAIRTENGRLLNEDGSVCMAGCPRSELRTIQTFEGVFLFLRVRYIAGDAAVPATINAQLYGLP